MGKRYLEDVLETMGAWIDSLKFAGGSFSLMPRRAVRDLLDLAHKRDWEPFDRSIDIRVARLRKKIERDPAKPQIIKTIPGTGYMHASDGR